VEIKKNWKKRCVEFADLPRISNFRKIFQQKGVGSYRRSFGQDYYEWKYFKNPIQTGEAWIVEDKDKIVGLLGTTPKKIKILNKKIVVAELGDGLTHPDYQRKGIFSSLVKITLDKTLEKGINLIYGESNKRTLPGERKAGYEIVPYLGLKNFIKPHNIKKIISLKIKNKILTASSASLLNILLYKFSNVKKPSKLNKYININNTSYFDTKFNDFFDYVSKRYDIILERNREYLNWRYIEHPDNYDTYLARDTNNILGYLVTKIGYYAHLKVGYIADFLTVENANVFKNLLLVAIYEFHKKNVDLISCWALKKSMYAKVLKSAGFLPFNNIPVIIYKSEIGNKIINGKYKWHFTMGDTDNI